MTGAIVFGTRPEAIKLAPLIARLKQNPQGDQVKVICSGQHRRLLAQTMNALNFAVDVNFDLMVHNQTPAEILRRIVSSMDRFIANHPVNWILVQGDTATALAGALSGYLAGIPTIHLEAGLRTHDLNAPWPEEGFRQLISRVADLHLAPNQRARANLIAEGIPEDRIFVVGNPGLDIQDQTTKAVASLTSIAQPYFLVTLHRRENLGAPLAAVCQQLKLLLQRFPDHRIVWPRHPNPEVIEMIDSHFSEDCERIDIVEPMEYPEFLGAMSGASLIISDSGGVQEEGPSFGIPVAVMRDKTERQEVIDLNLAYLAGGDGRNLHEAVDALLGNPIDPVSVARWREIQGNGKAADRIVDIILDRFG